jgi:hypothetical protein
VRACHPRDSAEAFHSVDDTLIVGGHDDRIDATGLRGAPVDVLDHRSAGDFFEWFSRESCRRVTGGNDGD